MNATHRIELDHQITVGATRATQTTIIAAWTLVTGTVLPVLFSIQTEVFGDGDTDVVDEPAHFGVQVSERGRRGALVEDGAEGRS